MVVLCKEKEAPFPVQTKTMAVIFLLLILSVAVAAGFLIAFLWNVRSGQYDDQAAPPVRMLFDDPLSSSDTKTESQAK